MRVARLIWRPELYYDLARVRLSDNDQHSLLFPAATDLRKSIFD